MRGKIKEIFKQIRAKMKMEEVREVKAGRGKRGALAIKLGSKEDRKVLIKKNRELKRNDI